MGRTLPPFSQLIEYERRAWAPFRRALRKDDQVAFDRLFDCAKLHVQAGVYLSRPWPFEVIAMAMLLEHQKQLERVLARLEAACQSMLPDATPSLTRPQEPPALTGAVERLRAPRQEDQGAEAPQGTLPCQSLLQIGDGGQAVEGDAQG
jgi:hypothetical protein